MKKRVLAGVGLALALTASRASATTYCYTGVAGFSACASANITVNNGLTQLQVAIQNLSGSMGNTTFTITQFGLYYLTPPNYTGSLTALSPFTGWQNGTSSSMRNPGPTGTASWLGGAQTVNGNNYALVGCSVPSAPSNVVSTCSTPATFTFTLAAGSNFSLANLHVGIRGQAWTAVNGQFSGRSFKCYSSDPTCQPPTAVPEPATMALLGTGLVALSIAGFRRRRRENLDS
ncbi:MAG: PEP-CTERM sorting domain-containing protein [Gemmatimonadetes bacterium]|nr:PEP-CTERM sorting domain-containing protein [Gemmatimonadota bacterium]